MVGSFAIPEDGINNQLHKFVYTLHVKVMDETNKTWGIKMEKALVTEEKKKTKPKEPFFIFSYIKYIYALLK